MLMFVRNKMCMCGGSDYIQLAKGGNHCAEFGSLTGCKYSRDTNRYRCEEVAILIVKGGHCVRDCPR